METYTEALEYLKRFDLDMRYGPCLGITRMQRYTRAISLNIQPKPDPLIPIVIERFENMTGLSEEEREDLRECLWYRTGIMCTK